MYEPPIQTLSRVIEETIAPYAAEVDRGGQYPEESLRALSEAGLLGLISAADLGGGGEGMASAAEVVERLAATCGSTGMVVLMHYVATAVIEAYGPIEVREAIATGRHLSTLAFSEAGSRSHFWMPMSTATPLNGEVRLDARKSWVTSAGRAESYVWSSRPLRSEGPMTLWLVPASDAGLSVPIAFDGLGLRGNASSPVNGENVRVRPDSMLGDDGKGLDIALSLVLPWFVILSAAFSLGLMEALSTETAAHLIRTRLAHLDQSLIEQPVARRAYAQMRLQTDQTRAFLNDTLALVQDPKDDPTLRILEIKAGAGEAAVVVANQAMRLCGGAAFRKELGIERRFRDALAARVMAPTTDALLDFIGRVSCGLPLLDQAPA
jgi:alkylation response protein AidB-like acyl-CoA dehydrogenase